MITTTRRVGVVAVGLAAILGLGACSGSGSDGKDEAKDAGRITEDAGGDREVQRRRARAVRSHGEGDPVSPVGQ